MKAIIKKELADHFSSTRFLIIMSLIFMSSLLSAHMAGQGIQEALAQGGNELLAGRTFLLLFTTPGAFFSLSTFLALFGPLVGLILGFDAINREKNQGTLSKILSQPIYRDELILGKYLAGLITIAIVLTALILLLGGLGLMGVGVVPTLDEITRIFIFWLVSIAYIGFWLALAILMSIIFRSVATSALASASLWIFLAFFMPVLGQALAQTISPISNYQKPAIEELANFDRIANLIGLASPTGVYSQATAVMLDPTHRGAGQFKMATMSQNERFLSNHFQGGISTGQSLTLVIPDLLLLLGFSVITFILSYITFVRQEIRSV